MFDKNELCILLRTLQNSKCTTMLSCIYCDIVDNREEYAKSKYCVENCGVCKDVEEINLLIFKVQELLK